MIDLELLFTAQQAKNLTGIPVFSELRSAYFEREFTLQFADIHQKLSDLKKNHNYQSLRIKVSNILKEGHFTAYEQYALYEFKAESELQLSLLEDCLESSGHCYISAVQAMNIKAVLMALLLRAQCFNAMMRPKEAITLLKQAQSIAESIGDVRTYLSSLNTEGLCLYKEEKYEESISTFRTCISTWRQLGNVLEAETCHLNLCNALYLMGNVEEALKELRIIVSSLEEETTTHNVRQIYDIMYQNPGLGETYLTRLKIWVLGNLANCAAQKNLFSEAENAYLLSIQLSKGTVNEQALTKVYIGLINLYQANLMYMKAVEISEELLEHFLKIGNPRAFKEYLEQEISLLIVSGNGETADYIRQKWNKQYENADVTKNIFYQNEMPGYSYFDELSESQFREKLSVIQNQGDLKNSAKLLSQYAEAHVASSPSVASESYFEAAKCLYDNGDLAECKKNVCLGILCAFRAHESFDSGDELWLQACLDGQDNAVLSLWNQAYERKSEMAEDGYDKHFSELMFLVSSYAKNGVYLAQLCLTDFSESVFLACDLPLIMKLLDVLDGTELYNQFMTRIQTAFLSREESMVNFLRKDYFSQNAEKVLEQFEKGVQILIRLKNPNAAAVAGGIATIYRRREEWEKTLYYHQLSLDFYREKNLLNDVFIEITNLASAYDKMGDTDKAIGMLREALQKTAQRGLEHNHAAIAGNLAQLLSQQHAGTRYEKEILSCFAIEEQYFEASGEIRDLIISLLNQIEFYMQVPQKFEALILEKFHKADELILNHHLLEFYGKIRTLARFMPREYQKRPSSSNHRKKKPSSGLMNFFRKYFDRFSK
ncbi:MAG: tetratricopeptide repeat protein [Treponema sp.]|nr:tetratricopeptide repeat protein [Treponema sp.]